MKTLAESLTPVRCRVLLAFYLNRRLEIYAELCRIRSGVNRNTPAEQHRVRAFMAVSENIRYLEKMK